MIVIETCPKCGNDLRDEVICTYPPIPRKVCWNCGWSWTGKPEKITRVPFGGNQITDDTPTLTTTNTTIENISLKYYNCASTFEKTACINCSANPKNGGSGICFCTLGQNIVY